MSEVQKNGKRKCDEPLCERPAEVFISRRDKNKVEHLYCSGFCAQQDSPRRDGNTKSDTTVKSSFVEHIATSPDISSFGSMIKPDPEPPKEPTAIDEMRRRGIIEIKNDPLNLHGQGDGSTLKKLEQEIEPEVQAQSPDLSTELSPITEEDQSQQKKLIDDSIRSTHALAKNVMGRVKASNTVDPAMVNAACNAVKQMHSLLRLKLDIHKEFKEKSKQ